MKNITIVFSKSTQSFAPFSWAIMASEGTPYSHVAVKMLDEETGVMMYYQASHTMLNSMSEEIFLGQEQIIYSFDFQVDDSIAINIRRFAQQRMGLPYGTVSAIGLAYVQLAKYAGQNVHNPFKEVGATYVCS